MISTYSGLFCLIRISQLGDVDIYTSSRLTVLGVCTLCPGVRLSSRSFCVCRSILLLPEMIIVLPLDLGLSFPESNRSVVDWYPHDEYGVCRPSLCLATHQSSPSGPFQLLHRPLITLNSCTLLGWWSSLLNHYCLL